MESPPPRQVLRTPCAPASAALTSITRCYVTWAATAAAMPTATLQSSPPRSYQRCREGRSCWPDCRGRGRAGLVGGTAASTALVAEDGASGPAGVRTLLATPCLTLRRTCHQARMTTPPARTMRAQCARWRRRATEWSTHPTTTHAGGSPT